MVETESRGRRPATYVRPLLRSFTGLLKCKPRSCTLCRRRKVRCNRAIPCSNCLRSKKSSNTCVYENPPGQNRDAGPVPIPPAAVSITNSYNSHRSTLTSQPPSSLSTSSVCVSTPNSLLSNPDSQSLELRLRIRQLEEQLSKKTSAEHHHSPASTTTSNIQKLSSGLGGTFHVHCESSSSGQPQNIARSVAHKTRLFGQSHWAVNAILLVSSDKILKPYILTCTWGPRLIIIRFAICWS